MKWLLPMLIAMFLFIAFKLFSSDDSDHWPFK